MGTFLNHLANQVGQERRLNPDHVSCRNNSESSPGCTNSEGFPGWTLCHRRQGAADQDGGSPGRFRPPGRKPEPFRIHEVGCAGVELCLVMHRWLAASRGAGDCARQAIPTGIPTDLTNSDDGRPRRLLADDPRLL